MRLLPFVFLLIAAPASAQTQASAWMRAPTEAESAWNEVQQRSAEALSSQDCRVACRALESLQRATKRLCDIGPEHCEEARAKLRDATQRVRTTCPECEVQTTVPVDQPKGANPPAYGGSSDTLASESAPQKSGGCAGCSTSSSDPSIAGLVVIAALVLRRKKKPTV